MSSIINYALPFRYRCDKTRRLYRRLAHGEVIKKGDTIIYPHEVDEVGADTNIIASEPFLTTASIGSPTDHISDRILFLRPMEEPEPLVHVDGEPDVKYRKLKVGEVLRPGDLCWTKDAFKDAPGLVELGGKVDGYIPFDTTVEESDRNFYFRRVEAPAPPLTHPAAPRPDVTHILVPIGAASSLLDLWFGKYSITCEDGEEAAAWQQLKEALYPEPLNP